jgi:predicted O-methyltransferase YrrM
LVFHLASERLTRLATRTFTVHSKGTAIIPDDADFAFEDEPLLTARGYAEDLGGTDPVAPATGAVLRFLATAIGARSVVEIGTGCGSSGIWILRGMRPGGVLTSVDTEPEYHRVARKAFGQAGFAANQARLIVGRALDVLPRLSDGAYDMVFCDADPGSYPEFMTAGLRLLRAGGVIVFDDAMPGVTPGDPGGPPPGWAATGLAATAGVRELAEMVRIDEHLVPLRLAVAGGLIAAIKR